MIDRHHEEARLKFYDPDNETISIPLKYVDEVRQTQTSMSNVCGLKFPEPSQKPKVVFLTFFRIWQIL